MDRQEKDKIRLSDRILSALDQEDLKISETLTSALEMSMTRGTGGPDFVERRMYAPEIERAMDALAALREKKSGAD